MAGEISFGAIVFTAAPDAGASPQGAFVKVDGRESLLRSVELFVNRDPVKQIVVTVGPAEAEGFKSRFASHLMILGIKAATASSASLRDHLLAGLAKLPADVTHVLVHDGARPAVSALDVDALLDAAAKDDAVALVSRVDAPVVEVEAGQMMNHRMPKSLRSLLTPMAFKRAAFEEFASKGMESLLSRIAPLESSPHNLRANSGADAGLLKAMIALLPKAKVKGPSNPFEEASW